MNYFKSIKSFEDLKEQFKKLARINHPDAGGNAEIMKEINLQYDALFPIWKSKTSVDKQSMETANSTRRDFYTENGWKGSNHDWNRSLKEVAVIVRAYVKEKYPTFKFSVRTSYASMCKELHVSLKEAPFELYKTMEQLTEEDVNGIIRKANRNYEWTLNSWNQEEAKIEIERIWNKCGTSYMVYRDDISKMLKDIDSFVNSYNFSDCDGMTDYFHVDFYYFDCKPDYDFKIVEKTARIRNQTETQEPESKAIENADNNYTYDIKEDIDTRNNTKIYVVRVIEKLDRDEYIKVNNYIKSIGGYYSKFKHGFIFKEDPTELLNTDIKQDTQEEINLKARNIAETITDYSTQVIEELGLKYPEYINNDNYISRLNEKISHIKLDNSITKYIEYEGLKQALETILQNRTQQIEQEQKQAKLQQLTNKINKQIDSTQKKIDALSGDYKTNTWKRMNEQASRDSKIEAYQKDKGILQYLLDTIDNRKLTLLEENLIISSFRSEIYSYYIRHNAYLEKKGTALKEISYPKIDTESPDSWWNKEVPTKQKRLNKANIYNTNDLLKAVEEYEAIYTIINKPINQTEKKIKQLEREYKMQQKGDINFTPLEVVEQLIQYAKIEENSRVLEPSAGIGNIADPIKQITNNLDVCEYMYHFSELLKLKGHNVVANDFLEYETDNKYDAIIMNPPFSNEQNHIKHAYDLLKDDGVLVAISSPHWTFANDKKSIEFRQWLENETYFTKDLQSGTFEMTAVASKIIVIEKHEQTTERTA